MDTVYIGSGFVIGVVVGLTGVGGGSLMTPLLILHFGIAPATAVGTDLLYAALTKAAGVIAHARRGNVDWKSVRWLSAGSLPASAATLWALSMMSADPAAMTAFLTTMLAFALFATAAAVLARGRLARLAAHAPAPPAAQRARTIALGGVVGTLVTVTSVGAGALGTIALMILLPRVATARVVGTDIAHAVPLTLLAGLGHATLGGVDWALLGNLLAGSVPGIWLAGRAAHRVPERWLRSLLATLLVVVGVRLVL